MATFTKLPSGKTRVQVRRDGVYRGRTFATKTLARDWALKEEAKLGDIAANGVAKPPAGATVADLIEKADECATREFGRSKIAQRLLLKREIGSVLLNRLSASVLSDFVDRRVKQGAGGVTIAGNLSTLSEVLHWARYARQLDVPYQLPRQVRATLKHRNLSTRGQERDREPTSAELARLYAYWASNERQQIDMTTIVRFALASGMRIGEICRIEIADIDRKQRTVIIRDRKDPRNKLGNDQRVPLLDDAWDIVAPIIKDRTEGRVFDVNGKSASTAFTRACEALGIADLHLHDCRHAATASFFRMGLDIPRVALLTGHRTWQMLRRYTNIRPEDVRAAIKPKSPGTRVNNLRVVK